MSILRKIKKDQLSAAAQEQDPQTEQENAVDGPDQTQVVVQSRQVGKLQRIKAQQIEDAEKNGEENPYQAAKEAPEIPAKAQDVKGLAHYQTALDVDIRKVSNAKDLTDKARIKQAVLPTYLPFVEDYVDSGDNYPNNVAVHVMIWLIDIREIEHGLDLALYLIKQKQQMIERIKRDIPTWLIDEMYDWANSLLKQDQGASPYLDTLVAVAEKDHWDVHPLCMSKIYAMLAKHHVRNGEYETAHALCLKAKKVNPEKHGVKLLTEEIEKHISRQNT